MGARLSGAFGLAQRPATLELVRGPKHWPIGARPLALGRAPESDIVIPGDSVSRLHAWIVPTAHGALLVDQSRSGTWVNGDRIQAPWPLTPGDEVTIGEVAYRVGPPSPGARTAAASGGFGTRLQRWLTRYGPSEVLGTVAAVGTAVSIHGLTGSAVVAAYAGAVAENIVFYGIIFLRESIREAHLAGVRGRAFRSVDLLPVARNLVLEFGVAETVDTLFTRPLFMGLGLGMVGGNLGALAGKLMADVVFYGPVLAAYEWRLARNQARDATDRRRRTTAVGLEVPHQPD